jgi:hypothetical protein
VGAIQLTDTEGALIGRLLYTNGQKSHPVAYESETIERNLAAGAWREASADEALRWTGDKPSTAAGSAW